MTADLPRARVELSIDELVLHGVPPAQAHRVAEALRDRLTELAGDGSAAGAAARDLATVRVRAAGRPARDAAALGRGVAEQVWAQVVPPVPGGAR